MINVIFVCLISCCSWFMPLKDNLSCERQDLIQEVEIKTRDNYYQGNYDTYYYPLTDLTKPSFLQNCIDYCVNTYDLKNITTDNTNIVHEFRFLDGSITSRGHLPINLMYASSRGNSPEVIGVIDYISITKATYIANTLIYDIKLGFTLSSGFTYPISSPILIEYTSLVDFAYPGAMYGMTNYNISSDINRTLLSENYTANPHVLYDFCTNDPELSDASAYNKGYEQGYNYASQEILNDPNNDIYQEVYSDGESYGYQNGYADGLQDGLDTDSTALTIFTGIIDVGLLPVNVFIKMFNYEVFGINIAGLVSGLLTIAIVIIIIRIITGQKNGK